MALIPMEYAGGALIHSDSFPANTKTNSAGAINVGGNVSSKILLAGYDSGHAYRLIPWVRNDGLNYFQCLDSSWTKLPENTTISGTYYYIDTNVQV